MEWVKYDTPGVCGARRASTIMPYQCIAAPLFVLVQQEEVECISEN